MEITTAIVSSLEADVVEGEIRARSFAAKDVILLRLTRHSAVDILHRNVLDDDTVGRFARWPSIQVILLDINAIRVDVRHLDVAVGNTGNVTCSLGVGFDTRAVRVVQDFAVFEQDVGDVVVGFAAHAADAEPVATIAIHAAHADVVARRHGYTVILVADPRITQSQIVAGRDIEPIGIMCCCQAVGTVVRGISSFIVQRDVVDVETVGIRYVEAVNRPVLNVEVLDRGSAVRFADCDKVIWLRNTAVGSKSVPPCLAVTVDNGIRLGSYGDVCTGYFDEVDVAVKVLERCLARESHSSTSLELCQVERVVTRNNNIRKRYISAVLHRSWNIRILGHGTRVGSRRDQDICKRGEGSRCQDYHRVSSSQPRNPMTFRYLGTSFSLAVPSNQNACTMPKTLGRNIFKCSAFHGLFSDCTVLIAS